MNYPARGRQGSSLGYHPMGIIESWKQKEVDYYDERAKQSLEDLSFDDKKGDFEGFIPFSLRSYLFLQDFLKNKIKGKSVLDYGCGNGVHSVWLAQSSANMVGIDLSEYSLEVARKRLERAGVAKDRARLLIMDCESLEFPSNHFDIVFDGGTFSSLDLRKAISEIEKVLKPSGMLVGIETLGHNPLANFKRRINQLIGRRTDWAVHHIVRIEDLTEIKKRFKDSEFQFFHLISCLAFPFLTLPGGNILLKFLEVIDMFLLKIPFLQRYAFKVVFKFQSPKNS